jgi:hypothetical protein
VKLKDSPLNEWHYVRELTEEERKDHYRQEWINGGKLTVWSLKGDPKWLVCEAHALWLLGYQRCRCMGCTQFRMIYLFNLLKNS